MSLVAFPQLSHTESEGGVESRCQPAGPARPVFQAGRPEALAGPNAGDPSADQGVRRKGALRSRLTGGTDAPEHLWLVHACCHRQIHACQRRSRAGSPRKEAYERLEPYDGKLSRTVLKGAGDRNVTRLPNWYASPLESD